jgi:hypothetical protein
MILTFCATTPTAAFVDRQVAVSVVASCAGCESM